MTLPLEYYLIPIIAFIKGDAQSANVSKNNTRHPLKINLHKNVIYTLFCDVVGKTNVVNTWIRSKCWESRWCSISLLFMRYLRLFSLPSLSPVDQTKGGSSGHFAVFPLKINLVQRENNN